MNELPAMKNKWSPFLNKTVIILMLSVSLYAQNGSLSGKITDASTNEELIGANVTVAGTTLGASSDIDGSFAVKNIEAGTYSIRVSYISYIPITIEKVIIEPGKETKLNVSLQSSTKELEEIVITAEALKSSETSILKIQKNSTTIVDGMSAELIGKNNSTDATDVLKRMTGVTITDGKFAFIRGVGDRYNNTLLNGANLPSTDPEKKSFSYDIFPAGLIESIITSKTFSVDQPADFSGGLVQINTIEFPSKTIFDISASTSYNTLSTFKDFTSYSGGSLDFLGEDDGTRKMPNTINGRKLSRGSYSPAELQNIGSSFKNNWDLKNSKTPINSSYKFTYGNNLLLAENPLGYVLSLNYSNNSEVRQIEKSNYTFDGPRYNYDGNIYGNSVVWGGLLNLSYKFANTNKISFKNIFNQNADNEVTQYEGDYRYADQYREMTALRFVSRSLISSQVLGEHQFGLMHGLNLDYHVSYSKSVRNEPDARRYNYYRDIAEPESPLRLLLDQSLSTRYYGDLDDENYSAALNFKFKIFESPEMPSIKTGFNFDRKWRTFNARTFGFKNIPGGNIAAEDLILQQSIEKIFAPENFNSTFIEVTEITKPSDSYNSDQNIYSTYLMVDANLFGKLKIYAGVRYERSQQRLNSKSQTGEDMSINSIHNDLLPGINLTYSPDPVYNIRLAYSQTLARPEFRELAPFSYFDFISSELVVGNEKLKRSLIQNIDARFEMFPGAGEMIAVSLFYKNFKDPIEQILIASSSFEPVRSYENASKALNYGVELEIRKTLGFIVAAMQNFSLVSNLSLIHSEIDAGEKGGTGFQRSKRPLQGQADYIINLGLYYDDYLSGLSASVVYNKIGERINKVGYAGLGDIIEKPRDQIDFSISKNVFQNFKLKLTVKDILAQDYKFIQRTLEGDKTSELEKRGRNITFGISYNL